MVSGRRSFGWGLVKRTRRIPSTRAHGPQQIGEEGAAPGQVAAVGVDVLAEQGHLGHPRAGQAADLATRSSKGGHLRAADRGDDAEGARVVAARLDGDPGGIGERRGRRPERPVVVRRVAAGSGASRTSTSGPSVAARRSSAGARARLWVPKTTSTWPARCADPLAVLLGQAAAHGDLHARAGSPGGLQAAQVAVELVVGVLPDAAGVEHDDVGLLEVVGRLQAVGHQEAGQALGVVLVHLAPEGADVERPRRPSARRSGPR